MSAPSSPKKMVSFAVWGGLGLVTLLIVLSFIAERARKNNLDIGQPLLVLNQVKPFRLTNQQDQAVSLDTLAGKIWVADIIFTRCPGPCVYMTRRMKEMQDAIPVEWPVQLVSLTTDPTYDSPEILKKYAQRFGADPDRWQFITGPKPEVVSLAMDDLKLVLQEKAEEDRESPDDLFIHSTLLVLVDQQGRLRGAFESMLRLDDEEDALTDDAAQAKLDAAFEETKQKLLKAIQQLMNEN